RIYKVHEFQRLNQYKKTNKTNLFLHSIILLISIT
ncbi:MAG: hypothetical protein ACI84F_000394, partial [Pseudoalteromonas tetraodonis]